MTKRNPHHFLNSPGHKTCHKLNLNRDFLFLVEEFQFFKVKIMTFYNKSLFL